MTTLWWDNELNETVANKKRVLLHTHNTCEYQSLPWSQDLFSEACELLWHITTTLAYKPLVQYTGCKVQSVATSSTHVLKYTYGLATTT